MTKEETKQRLRKSGYNVIDDNSVVTIIIEPEASMKNVIKDVKDKLNSWGYNASFAIRQQKGAGEIEIPADDELVSVDMHSEEKEADDLTDDAIAENPEDNVIDTKKDSATVDAVEKNTIATEESADDDEYFDEEDSDMLLTEESIQFSLEDFGLDF